HSRGGDRVTTELSGDNLARQSPAPTRAADEAHLHMRRDTPIPPFVRFGVLGARGLGRARVFGGGAIA
ncbi:hypothetical protein, partial [Streptomyces rimosus]|uniref:hypothetical protein n=1 Tax=Streptomyces rimosus TaxID=1927 RepID=UPI001A935A8F